MKRLTALFVLAAGPVFAHGAHAPVPETAHAMAHAAPWLAVAALAVGAVLVVLKWRAGS